MSTIDRSQRHRLFMGCPLPPDFCERLAEWAREFIGNSDVRLIPAENMHVTLLFFGEVSPAKRDELIKLAELAILPSTQLECGQVMARGYGAIAVNLNLERDARYLFWDQIGSNRNYRLPEIMPPIERKGDNRAFIEAVPMDEIEVEYAGREVKFAPWSALIDELPQIEIKRYQREKLNISGWPRFPLHVSVARTRKPFEPAEGPTFNVVLNQAALYESRLSPEGASYEILARGQASDS